MLQTIAFAFDLRKAGHEPGVGFLFCWLGAETVALRGPPLALFFELGLHFVRPGIRDRGSGLELRDPRVALRKLLAQRLDLPRVAPTLQALLATELRDLIFEARHAIPRVPLGISRAGQLGAGVGALAGTDGAPERQLHHGVVVEPRRRFARQGHEPLRLFGSTR